jgi:VanZ family protein
MISKFIHQVQLYFSGKPTIKKFIPGITWFFVLLILLCIPGRDLPESGDWLQKIFFDKWVHAGLFGILAFLFMAPVYAKTTSDKKKWLYVIAIAFLVSGWGLATEFIQHNLVSGRSFDLYDWAADTLG